MSAQLASTGDASTWEPCTGHPNDPRTPDLSETPEFKATQDELMSDRVNDLNGYLMESFTEAEGHQKKALADAYLNGDILMLGIIAKDLITNKCTPSESDVQDLLSQQL